MTGHVRRKTELACCIVGDKGSFWYTDVECIQGRENVYQNSAYRYIFDGISHFQEKEQATQNGSCVSLKKKIEQILHYAGAVVKGYGIITTHTPKNETDVGIFCEVNASHQHVCGVCASYRHNSSKGTEEFISHEKNERKSGQMSVCS